MSVRCCVPVTDITAAVCAIARRALKDPNVKSQRVNVKCLDALDMDVVLMENAIANVDIRAMIVPYVSKIYGRFFFI